MGIKKMIKQFTYFIYVYYFQIIATVAILLSCYTSLEHQAHLYILSANEKSLAMLVAAAEIKQLLAVVSGLDISFIKTSTANIIQTFEKIENTLIVSGFVTTLQLFIMTLSKHLWLKLLAVGLLAGTFVTAYRRICCKILIVVLAINPGIAVYSVTVKGLSDEVSKTFNATLYTKLSTMSQHLKQETNTLTKQHQKQLEKIKKSHSDFTFFKKLWSDVKYDVSYAKDTIESDYQELKIVLASGGKNILKETLIYITQLILLLVLLPLGYLWLVIKLCQKLFNNIPHGTVNITNGEFFTSMQHGIEQAVASTKTQASNEISSAKKQIDNNITATKTRIENKVRQTEITANKKIKENLKSSEKSLKKSLKATGERFKADVSHEEPLVKNKDDS